MRVTIRAGWGAAAPPVTVTADGVEAMPFTTTWSVDGPSGALVGRTNVVDPGVPGATDSPVEPDVRA